MKECQHCHDPAEFRRKVKYIHQWDGSLQVMMLHLCHQHLLDWEVRADARADM